MFYSTQIYIVYNGSTQVSQLFHLSILLFLLYKEKHVKLSYHLGLAESERDTSPNLAQLHVGCSVTQSYPTLCNPMDYSMPGFPVLHNLQSLFKFMSIQSVMLSNHLILSHPLLLLLSIFPNIRVFSNESIVCIRWPKYWSFSFSISSSNEYSGLISFRIDWFDLLAVRGTLKSLL